MSEVAVVFELTEEGACRAAVGEAEIDGVNSVD